VAALAGNSTSGAYFSKEIVVVDEDVDPTNMDEVIWALATRFDPADDIDILTDTWSTSLDPSRNPPEERPYGSKMLVDATKDHKHLADFPDRLALREETYERVRARWTELGFDGEPPDPPMFADLSDAPDTEASDGPEMI
jgi:4-hydroxy-3-polyprenylbenzoate decarboxylase